MSFIVIEGLDGSGKSTQVGMLRKYLTETGIPFNYLHFPRTEAPFFGELVARFLRGELGEINQVHPRLVALIYAGDRMDAGKQIRDWMAGDNLVLVDRYTYSNIAYQCAKIDDPTGREQLAGWIRDLEFGHFKIPKPDLSIYLDVPFSFIRRNLTQERTGHDREYLVGSRDIHEEDLNFQQRVHEAYLWQTGLNNEFLRLDCSNGKDSIREPDAVFGDLLDLCRRHHIFSDVKNKL
jgi:dTMP kinase